MSGLLTTEQQSFVFGNYLRIMAGSRPETWAEWRRRIKAERAASVRGRRPEDPRAARARAMRAAGEKYDYIAAVLKCGRASVAAWVKGGAR